VLAVQGGTLLDIWGVWQAYPETSHGMLVPIVTIYLIVSRRRDDDPPLPVPGWLALGLFGVAELLRWWAPSETLFLRSVSAVTSLAALVVLVIGPRASWRSIGPIVLLALAVPLPDAFIDLVTAPLQALATSVSASLLILCGQPVIHEGSSLFLGKTPVNIAPECDGLSMITGLLTVHAFVALSGTFHWTSKAVILVLAVPMALVANVGRVAATAIAFRYWGGDLVRTLFHDAAGWLMMPLALGFLYGALAFLDWCRRWRTSPA